MNERVRTGIKKLYKKCFVPHCLDEANFASAILSLGKYCFLPSSANVFKNNITSSVRHIIVCLLKTES